MSKFISAVLIIMLILTAAISVNSSDHGSAQLSSPEMTQLVGGKVLRCMAGTVGFGILGVLGGAAFGGVGAIFGGIGGILVGAAGFC